MFSHIIYKPIAGEAGVSGVDVMRMKDVIISVTGVQQGVNGPDAMELITAGQYGQDEKETLLTWQESELTGMEGTKTSLRVQPRERLTPAWSLRRDASAISFTKRRSARQRWG